MLRPARMPGQIDVQMAPARRLGSPARRASSLTAGTDLPDRRALQESLIMARSLPLITVLANAAALAVAAPWAIAQESSTEPPGFTVISCGEGTALAETVGL